MNKLIDSMELTIRTAGRLEQLIDANPLQVEALGELGFLRACVRNGTLQRAFKGMRKFYIEAIEAIAGTFDPQSAEPRPAPSFGVRGQIAMVVLNGFLSANRGELMIGDAVDKQTAVKIAFEWADAVLEFQKDNSNGKD